MGAVHQGPQIVPALRLRRLLFVEGELHQHARIDAERQAWLTSARAWGESFPQFAALVTLIEARLLKGRPELRGSHSLKWRALARFD